MLNLPFREGSGGALSPNWAPSGLLETSHVGRGSWSCDSPATCPSIFCGLNSMLIIIIKLVIYSTPLPPILHLYCSYYF